MRGSSAEAGGRYRLYAQAAGRWLQVPGPMVTSVPAVGDGIARRVVPASRSGSRSVARGGPLSATRTLRALTEGPDGSGAGGA